MILSHEYYETGILMDFFRFFLYSMPYQLILVSSKSLSWTWIFDVWISG